MITDRANSAASVLASDLDNDGDNEVLFAAISDDKIAWHDNLGNGDFGEQQRIAPVPMSPAAIFAADMDGDNDWDIISASVLG